MALNLKQASSHQTYRYSTEEFELRPVGNPPRAPMPEVNWSVASELINLNQLIEDVGSLLPASTTRKPVLNYDLATDLPLIEGDYRLIRRLFLNLLSDVNGIISLRTRFARSDRAYLTDHFPGANLPEGQYVLIQVAELDSDTIVPRKPGFGLKGELLFPCVVKETTRDEPAETVGPQSTRRERADQDRIWLFMRVQRSEIELLSVCFTTSNESNAPRPESNQPGELDGMRPGGHGSGDWRNKPRVTGCNNFYT